MDAAIRNGQGPGQGALGGSSTSTTANPSSGAFTTGGQGFTTGQSRHSTPTPKTPDTYVLPELEGTI
jgi:hypothetical protein|eukprot:COSAG06_NODE_2757_length_6335_cov_3.434734_7_plen_67_part_00